MNNLSFFIKKAFRDDFCENSECAICPFYIQATGSINGEDCKYLCDFLYQIKRGLENDK